MNGFKVYFICQIHSDHLLTVVDHVYLQYVHVHAINMHPVCFALFFEIEETLSRQRSLAVVKMKGECTTTSRK